MVSAVSALGNGPCAIPTRQAVCKLVTPNIPTAARIPFIFNIAPSRRSRWSPVVLQWKTFPISFSFLSLPNSLRLNEGGTHTPSPHEFHLFVEYSGTPVVCLWLSRCAPVGEPSRWVSGHRSGLPLGGSVLFFSVVQGLDRGVHQE